VSPAERKTAKLFTWTTTIKKTREIIFYFTRCQSGSQEKTIKRLLRVLLDSFSRKRRKKGKKAKRNIKTQTADKKREIIKKGIRSRFQSVGWAVCPIDESMKAMGNGSFADEEESINATLSQLLSH